MAETRRPDAILFPSSFKAGKRPVDRIRNVQDKLGPILAGEEYVDFRSHPVYVRDVGPDKFLVTLSAADTLLYPSDHPYAKTPRYDWKPQANGLEFGYLKVDDSEDENAT